MLKSVVGPVVCAGICILSASLAQAESGYVDSDGVKIHYIEQGEGDAVILIHGYSASAMANWVVFGILGDLAKDFRVIAIDARGHGLSGKPHGAEHYGIKMVDDIVNVMDALEIERAHVGGYSMGGYITTKFLIDHPERVISAVPAGAGWKKSQPREEGTNRSQRDAPDATRRMLESKNDPVALASVLEGIDELNVTEEELRANKIPTMVLVGTQDGMIRGVRELERVMGNLTAVYVEGEGHASMIGNKEYRAKMKAHFLAHSLETSER
jgi:pimeloyl-ACP methyl ester carboxylesterase